MLALSPDDVLPAVYLCTNKIASNHENIVSKFLSHLCDCAVILYGFSTGVVLFVFVNALLSTVENIVAC